MEKNQNSNPVDALTDIRSMMERSTRYLSLSGLSGISAGLVAILGALALWLYGDYHRITRSNPFLSFEEKIWGYDFPYFIVIDAIVVLVLAVGVAAYFSYRKAKKQNLKFWDHTAKRVSINLLVPLASGGIFCFILLIKGYDLLVAPTTLLVYGLSLINASNFTFHDVRYLGYAQIITGIIATVFTGYGLIFWVIGFGFFHIIYGIRMYYKYEK